ncbi:NAD-dependent protein deacylase [Paenibacillus sp. F411]|uniref:NAD-dependent protein deacylase n=1 Tax=Paenibacillus sp. F411 TaxID=2820239 RepID=UPI001AAE863E|nr:NAD-dependent protein deacylase [Paenibacillus sp. F411]MBO2945990.1 NAD-dependent protein deacylase [Paenibacillus sp. F411]
MIARWLMESRYTVIFTGAGMSTESGVPDFRSSQGLWRGTHSQSLASVEAMEQDTGDFVSFYRSRIEALQHIQPHKGYAILNTWAEKLHVKSIITQNTDFLHQKSANRNVITLHGTIQQLHCRICKAKYPAEYYINEQIYCSCGGFIRPSVVLFGESLDHQSLADAESESAQADLFIVLGSSLVVSPANLFPQIAKEHGARLVIVNHDPTPLDSLADAVIHDTNIGDFLEDISLQTPVLHDME